MKSKRLVLSQISQTCFHRETHIRWQSSQIGRPATGVRYWSACSIQGLRHLRVSCVSQALVGPQTLIMTCSTVTFSYPASVLQGLSSSHQTWDSPPPSWQRSGHQSQFCPVWFQGIPYMYENPCLNRCPASTHGHGCTLQVLQSHLETWEEQFKEKCELRERCPKDKSVRAQECALCQATDRHTLGLGFILLCIISDHHSWCTL